MIRIDNVRLCREPGKAELISAAAAALGVKPDEIASVEIIRRSIDARKKSDVHYVFSLAAELKSGKTPRGAQLYEPKSYSFPVKNLRAKRRPVVVGMGPAGLFAALMLAEAGAPPLIIERGRSVERRSGDVESFFRSGALDPVSNVQFGEGGAGTFSDGKLATGISDARIGFFLRRMAGLGAPEDIVYDSAPHVGTDVLKTVLKNARERLLALGCEIRFESRLSKVTIKNGALASAAIEHGGEEYRIDEPLLILAPGNGARDTFEMLHSSGVALKPKNFAVGVRIEHLQRDIDAAQYGSHGRFPPASYKIVSHPDGERAAYSFCVCPGGSVIAAASEPGGAVTNGMSERARAGENICGALLAGVTPADFPAGPLGGMAFQREIERAAFKAGGGSFFAPAQLVGDFLARRPSKGPGKVKPSYRPGVTWCDLHEVLPDFVCRALEAALPEFGRRIRGFDDPDAVLTAPETRSSSPVRIERGTDFCSVSARGLYPCGEGAGYAGGITSSAVDGIKCAEALALLLDDKGQN